MIVWADGRLVPPDAAVLTATDHGVTVGDGVFESLKVRAGVPFALSRHLRRLQRSAAGLGLEGPSEATLRAAVAETIAADPTAGRLRITVTAGPAPLGSDRGAGPATLLVIAGPPSRWPDAAELVSVPWPRNERSALAGLKTTSYAENVVALAYAKERGGQEALFCDTRGRVSEGTGSNVFAVVDGVLLTPTLATGCLDGVTRGLVLEWTAAIELDLSPSELLGADEVFITSSTRDIQPVRRIDDAVWRTPGPVTADVMAVFSERSGLDSDP
jgi:branched-chain amino acid aminotransferase